MTSSEDKARQHYQGEAGERYHQSKRLIPEEAYWWVARLRAAKIAPYMGPDDVVLEYGVGLGWNLAALPCRRRIGYDVGEFLEAKVRDKAIEFVRDLALIPALSVDMAICHHTLEHVWNPPQVLAAIQQLLRKDGLLLLFVPFEKERRFRQFNPHEPNHHLFSWNVQTLGNLVSEAGFHVISAHLGRFGQERFAANWAIRLRIGERGFRVLRWLANSAKHELEVRVVARNSSTAAAADLPIA